MRVAPLRLLLTPNGSAHDWRNCQSSAIGWRDAAGWVLCGEHRRQNSSVESKVRECEGLIFGGKSCILDSVS